MRSIEVVAGVIRSDDAEILISLRPDHLDQGGLWEFPGGKLELGESRFECLARELEEELGIKVHRAEPRIALAHDYPDKRVMLDVWDVQCWSGKPQGLEGQQLKWVEIADLKRHSFPPANDAIVESLLHEI